MPKIIHVAHSPDSDDAFMFYALAEGKIDTGDLSQRENQSLASRHVELTESLNRQLGHEIAPQKRTGIKNGSPPFVLDTSERLAAHFNTTISTIGGKPKNEPRSSTFALFWSAAIDCRFGFS